MDVCYGIVGHDDRQAIFAAAIWPVIPTISCPRVSGTAYGIFVSVQNIGLSVGAAVVSAVQPPRCENRFFCSLGVLAGCAGVEWRCFELCWRAAVCIDM